MALNTYNLSTSGTGARTYAAVTNGDTVAPSGNVTFLHIKNGNAAICTVTISDSGVTPAGNVGTAKTVAVPATTGDEMIVLPLAAAAISTGAVTITYSVTATVTGAFIKG